VKQSTKIENFFKHTLLSYHTKQDTWVRHKLQTYEVFSGMENYNKVIRKPARPLTVYTTSVTYCIVTIFKFHLQ